MEAIINFDELHDYVAKHYNQNMSFSKVNGRELRITFSKRILIKDVNVSVDIRIVEVKSDEVTVAYNGGIALDVVISGALSFIMKKYPFLVAGISTEDGNRIRINLTQIKKAKALVENVSLKDISIEEGGIRASLLLH